MDLVLEQKQAIQNFSEEHRRWYKNNIDTTAEGTYAIQRINSGIVRPVNKPFEVSKTDNFFAIGSCFARGVEKALHHRGLNVISISDKFSDFERSNEKVTGLGFTNKYSSYSILNQLEWSLGEKPFPTASVVDLPSGIAIDPHTNPSLKFVDREKTLERRRILNEVVSEIKSCKNVIITLGLIELWYDKLAGCYLNISPTKDMMAEYPNRYEFLISDYQANYTNLEKIYALLAKHCAKDFNLIITVSPVPLLATFSDRDIIIANTYSKSLLRTAAESLSFKYENVKYFPSYEMVMNSDRNLVWEEDGRHVKGSFVQHIMRHFIDSHLR